MVVRDCSKERQREEKTEIKCMHVVQLSGQEKRQDTILFISETGSNYNSHALKLKSYVDP